MAKVCGMGPAGVWPGSRIHMAPASIQPLDETWLMYQTVPAGPMPQTFAIPAKAWDYGAETAALEPIVTEQPGVVRVQLGEVRGAVGVSLARPDGSALVSKERPVTANDSGKAVYFRVTGREGLIAVLLRNYNAEGQVGSVAVNAIAYVPEEGLSRDQLSEINKGGVN